jgi:hypothetical protein
MSRNTLTPQEWELVLNLPADGQDHCIPGVAFRAKHLPQTKMKVEQVICETQFGTLRRIKARGKWQATDYIQNYNG